MSQKPLLQIKDLVIEFGSHRHPFRAVDGVSIEIAEGETVGLVGESGSGKTTIGRAVLGLVKPAGGSIAFGDEDITSIPAHSRRGLAAQLQVVFQDPYSSLNPSLTIGQILAEPLTAQKGVTKEAARARIADLLAKVGLPEDAIDRYPTQFSGGQRQRIAIARALALSPRLVICDEPVSALDLSTQAQVLNLLADLRESASLSYLFIAHDLAVVKHLSHRIVVLYKGRIMEMGPGREVYENPRHPYTRALLAAAPVPDPRVQQQRRSERKQMVSSSASASIASSSQGCPFAARCPLASQVCLEKRPTEVPVGGVTVACHAYDPTSGYQAPAVAAAG